MTQHAISICGYPESGKTTYLAALWHLVTTAAEPTALKFESLREGDSTHLNEIAARWRSGLKQLRTEIPSNKVISMNLRNASGDVIKLTLPDLSGESYRNMFEDRECDSFVAGTLESSEGMLLLIHSDNIKAPQMVVTVASQSESLGISIPAGQEIAWSPKLAPTQVQLVELLQLLREPPLHVPFKRIAVILSAWDKVESEGRSPDQFVAERLPLLKQYLDSGADSWQWKVYGVSAQGGDYESAEEPLKGDKLDRLNELRSYDEPSMRIKVYSTGSQSSDLTEPIAWLFD